jgi:hypothetical protein
LSSWKEIAAYLKCDESTARRWERESGLPIHRIGNKGGSVYGYVEEIERWLGQSPPSVETGLKDESALPPENHLKAENANKHESHTLHVEDLPSQPSKFLTALNSKSILCHQGKRLTIGALILVGIIFATSLIKPKSKRIAAPSASLTQAAKSSTNTSAGSIEIASINSAATDQTEEEMVFHLKAFVKQTQIWEMLTLYSSPWSCDARDVQRYWLVGSKAFVDIGESVSRLNERGWHYGYDSRLLDFQFRYVRIAPDGSSATVGTREHWWLPLYTRDEKIASNRSPDQGPYEIEYLLTKVNGFWYLKSTTTPYLQRKPKQISCRNWPQ